MMKERVHIWEQRFLYPGFTGRPGHCQVNIFAKGELAVVVLRDQDNHGSTSVTNAIEAVAAEVKRRLLIPHGLDQYRLIWVHWSRVDRVLTRVEFADPERFQNPSWRFLPWEEFTSLLEEVGGIEEVRAWLEEGSLVLREMGWQSTRDDSEA